MKNKITKFSTLQIVFKIVERCNIDCTYCYYFNREDSTALQRPPTVDLSMAEEIAKWVAKNCIEMGIKHVNISFHGGEPMMLNSQKFEKICQYLTLHISPVANLSLSIQTNGTILNDKWIEIFYKYAIRVGVSIDGNKTEHDRFRVDRKGNSTFKKTELNLQKYLEWDRENDYSNISTISVLNWKNKIANLYVYLRELGVQNLSFLLPDYSIDNGFAETGESSLEYGKILFDIFKSWLDEDNPNVNIRYISDFLSHLQVATNQPQNTEQENDSYQIIIMQSDGKVAINDSFMPAFHWYKQAPKFSITKYSLRNILESNVFNEINHIHKHLPAYCQTCKWKKVCKGGDIENRFSKNTGFDNPSIYCEGYQYFYENACNLLVKKGYPQELLVAKLN